MSIRGINSPPRLSGPLIAYPHFSLFYPALKQSCRGQDLARSAQFLMLSTVLEPFHNTVIASNSSDQLGYQGADVHVSRF
jgi:hypothetical protein